MANMQGVMIVIGMRVYSPPNTNPIAEMNTIVTTAMTENIITAMTMENTKVGINIKKYTNALTAVLPGGNNTKAALKFQSGFYISNYFSNTLHPATLLQPVTNSVDVHSCSY